MDGVIIDSEPIHSRVKMDTFHHFGLSFDEAELVNYMGRTSEAIFGEVLAKEKRTDICSADMVQYKHDHYLEVLRSGTIGPVGRGGRAHSCAAGRGNSAGAGDVFLAGCHAHGA
jgi:beta-phosphoglucomutase-like phosphatase (HAD superfamily)